MRPASLALLCLPWASMTACGPAPNLYPPETPEPVEIAEPAPAPMGWNTPSLPTPRGRNDGFRPYRDGASFAPGSVYEGRYLCAQGDTGMVLRIDRVDGRVVHGIFEFFHEPTSARGSFTVEGEMRPGNEITFDPVDWIERPSNYIAVPFRLVVSDDASTVSGGVLHPSCGSMVARRTKP